MLVNKPHLLTEEGLQRLTEELQEMKTVGREVIADRLHRAFEDGQDDDFVDNAELEAARNEQSFLEGRIQELEDILRNFTLINEDETPHESVKLGDWVTIEEDGYDEQERYQLVGAAEADPAAGRVSNESPLGYALVGANLGDIVDVNAPRGIVKFKIVKIE